MGLLAPQLMQKLHGQLRAFRPLGTAPARLQAPALPVPAMRYQQLHSGCDNRAQIVFHGSAAGGLDVAEQIPADSARRRWRARCWCHLPGIRQKLVLPQLEITLRAPALPVAEQILMAVRCADLSAAWCSR